MSIPQQAQEQQQRQLQQHYQDVNRMKIDCDGGGVSEAKNDGKNIKNNVNDNNSSNNNNNTPKDQPIYPTPPPLNTLRVLRDFLVSLSMQDPNREDSVLRVVEYLYGHEMLSKSISIIEAETKITKITSTKSNRTMYTILGESNNYNHGLSNGRYYMCMLPDTNGLYYCSCNYFSRNVKDKNLCSHLLALVLMPYFDGVTLQQVHVASDYEFGNLVLSRTMGI